MPTYILLNNYDKKEYAVWDIKPGDFTNGYMKFRDTHIVHNDTGGRMNKAEFGTRITVPEWIARYEVPECLERIYK